MNNIENPNSNVLREKLVKDVREVISDAESLIKVTAEDLSEKAKSARARLASSISQAREKILDAEEIVREKAVAGAKETDRMIREHPYETVGVAFAVGLLIGFLVSRK